MSRNLAFEEVLYARVVELAGAMSTIVKSLENNDREYLYDRAARRLALATDGKDWFDIDRSIDD